MTENNLISRDEFTAAKEYWMNKLAGDINEMKLPSDFPRTLEYKRGNYCFMIDAETSRKLFYISNEKDLAIYVILAAALNVLLYKYTNCEDIIVGTPIYSVSGRIYDYNKCTVIRNVLKNEMTFKELMMSLKQTLTECYKNQHYPVKEALKLLGIDGDLISLFRILLVSREIHQEEQLDDIINSSANDITFTFGRKEGELEAKVTYNALLFEPATMQRLSLCLQNTLRQAMGDINKKLKEIELVSEEEKLRILSDFNDTRRDFGGDLKIVRMFEDIVAKIPDNTAVEYEDKQITYRELNSRANILARTLREKGVESNSIVGILTESGIEMAVSILGVLKSGGAYLPLDPDFPEERVKKLIRDSGAKVLLSSGCDRLRELCLSAQVMDFAADIPEHGDDSNLEDFSSLDDLAYVIYTSGSTGEPKGVEIERASLVNFIRWRIEEYGYGSSDVTLQLLPVAFDGYGTNFYCSLFSGGVLVTPDSSHRRDFSYIARHVMEQKKITNFSVVPSIYMSILENSNEGAFKCLRFVVLAGESADEGLIRKSKAQAPETLLINEYGPTESTITAAFFKGMNPDKPSVIGRPVSNNRLYILNGSHDLMPVGIPGELCISGYGLARGYLNRPEFTAEKFISNPFLGESNVVKTFHETSLQRLYRTGDMAKWLPDGNIQFLGRMDSQLKIRGYRVELGEIESCILKFKPVKKTVVAARENASGEKTICAYVVCDGQLNIEELQAFLSRELLDQMIPAHFIQLESIPLTPNGKVDTRALPEPGGIVAKVAEYEAPRNAMEEKMVEMWQEILGVDKIGIKDNFFNLGGHSLKATTFVSGVYKAFNVELPLNEVFLTPTIRELSAYLQKAEKNTFETIKPVKPAKFYKATPAQERLYALSKLDGVGTTYNVSGAATIEGRLDIKRLLDAFRQLIRRHEVLRTSFGIENGELVQLVHEDAVFTIEHSEMTGSEFRKEETDLSIYGFIRPFDLSEAPLLRVRIVKLSGCDDRQLLLYDMHHIISDGVSMSILIDEFTALYNGQELPPVKAQYKDFAAWQDELLSMQFIKKQEAFWLDRLSPMAAGGSMPQMPTDYPRPSIQSFDGDSVGFRADTILTGKLNRLALETGSTMSMLLLAAYNILFMKYAGWKDIAIGLPVSGRNHADLERTLGVFVNTLVMRNTPEKDMTFKNFLESVRDNAVKAYDNQEYQFEMLIEKLGVKRDNGRNPLFDAIFVILNAENRMAGGVIKVGDFVLKPYEFRMNTAKADLTLQALEYDGKIAFDLIYCTALFKRETAEALAAGYLRILESVAADNEALLSDIEIISASDKDNILSQIQQRKKLFNEFDKESF